MTVERPKHAQGALLQLPTPHAPPTIPVCRRIPRGNTGRSDPLDHLVKAARKGVARIRGMESRVLDKAVRNALRKERRRLAQILTKALQSPEQVTTGTHTDISGALNGAVRMFEGAQKRTKHPRHPKRSSERRGVRPKNRPGRYNGDEPIVAAKSRRPSVDPAADAFQAELEAMAPAAPETVRPAREEGAHGCYDMSAEQGELVNK